MSRQHPEDFRDLLDASDVTSDVGRLESPSDWLRDQVSAQTAGDGDRTAQPPSPPSPPSRVTRRLAEDRISLPGPRTTVYSEEHGGSVQVDPWFAPDGTLRGGILILPDGAEIRAGPDVIEQMLGPDELYEARRRLGLVPGDSVDDGDDDLAIGEMEAGLPVAPLHAQIDSQGVPQMPDSAPTYFGRQLGRPPQPSGPQSGNWGYDAAFDDEHGLVSGTLLRNARKAGHHAWPLALLGAGWLWDRAQPLAQRLAAQWPNLHTGSTTRRTRIRRRVWMGALAAALVCLGLSFCGIVSLVERGNQLGVSNLPTNPVDANATIAVAASATAASAQATATASAIIASGGIPPTPLPTNATDSTPTSHPNLFAPNARVSFTRASYTANAPSTLATYDGAIDDATGGSTRGQKLSSGPTTRAGGSWGNTLVQTQGATATVAQVYYACDGGSTNSCQAPAGTLIPDQVGEGKDCVTQATITAPPGDSSHTVACRLQNTGPLAPSCNNYCLDPAPCGSSCSANWGTVASYVLGSNAQSAWFTPNPCNGDGGSAARSNVANGLAMGTGLGADAIGQQTSYSTSGYCASPTNCAAWSGGENVGGATTYTICASGGAWKLTYSPTGVQTLQKARIVPNSGYAIDTATLSVCSSVSVQSTDIANQRATLFCPASATARYVWTSGMLATLANQVAGKTVGEAQSIIAAATGVGSNVSVNIPGGYAYLPTDPSAITMTVN